MPNSSASCFFTSINLQPFNFAAARATRSSAVLSFYNTSRIKSIFLTDIFARDHSTIFGVGATPPARGLFDGRGAYNSGMKSTITTVPQTQSKFTSHSFAMTDRKKASLTGVTKVDGMTDTQIDVTTCLGRLIITGSELKISKFDVDDGNLALTGNIDAIKYAQAKQSLIKRIFK